MTDEELNAHLSHMADAVSRVAEASASGIQNLTEGQKQVQLAQLGTQYQIGMLSDLMGKLIRRIDTLAAGYEQQQAILNELIRRRPNSPDQDQ